MSWFKRLILIRTINAKVKDMDDFKRNKYLSFFRVAYFFAASSLCLAIFNIQQKYDKLEEEKKNRLKMEAGHPVIQDESETHASFRKKGVETGVMYKYSTDKGWHLEEYHRAEYMSKMQKKALEDAREAQRKALAEGRELPPDAIILIDEAGST
jgi:hypothetical protein